jgi:hypothetical protein
MAFFGKEYYIFERVVSEFCHIINSLSDSYDNFKWFLIGITGAFKLA